jgi:hypothetical protein
VDSCQPCIPSASGVLADLFQVFKENAEKSRVEIFDRQLGRHFAESLFCKLQKQPEGIPIAGYGVWARLSLPKEPISKERLKKRL